MPTHKLTFTGSSGQELAARLELPTNGRPSAYALFAHCFSRDLLRGVDARCPSVALAVRLPRPLRDPGRVLQVGEEEHALLFLRAAISAHEEPAQISRIVKAPDL